MMLIEQIGAATFANGLVRIQCLAAGADGQLKETGTIEVPGNVAAELVNALVNTLNSLETQLSEATSKEEKTEKSSNDEGKDNGKSKAKSKKNN